MPAPLTLSLTPLKAELLVGEGAALRLRVDALRPYSFHLPELSDRSRVVLTTLDDPPRTRVLTSADHCQLHRVSRRRFTAFQSVQLQLTPQRPYLGTLKLLDYERPLPPGHYRLALRYQYGSQDAHHMASNEVELTVRPADHVSAHYRWFGETGERGVAAALWVLRDGAGERLLYQTARRGDPSALQSSVVLDLPLTAADAPRLARLNGSGSFYPARHIAWADATHVRFAPVSDAGVGGDVIALEHGLDPAPRPRLVDPPLQRREGGLAAAVAGFCDGRPALSVVEQSAAGAADQRILRPGGAPTHLAVLWGDAEDRVTGACFWTRAPAEGQGWRLYRTDLETTAERALGALPQEVLALALDQWRGEGWLYALTRQAPGPGEDQVALRVWSLPAHDAAPAPTYRLGYSAPAPCEVLQVEPLPGGVGLALLVSCPEGLLALAPGLRREVPREGRAQVLVASDQRLFAVSAPPGLPLEALDLTLQPEPAVVEVAEEEAE